MSTFDMIAYGFSVVLNYSNLLYCFIGVTLGTLIGVLPGLGPVATIAVLLPMTFYIPPVSSIIMLAGIFYGAQYGGSTTSILINVPGEATTVCTCLDGYKMAQQGRAGRALGIAAFGSFIAGTISTAVLMLIAPPLAEYALKFGPPEYCVIMVLGMTFLIYLASESILKSLSMAMLGMILACVGTDVTSGAQRFTFGILELSEGISIVPLVMGLFGIAEILTNIEQVITREIFKKKVKGLMPDFSDWRASAGPIGRGSIIGFLFGILPGAGSIVSTFISYGLEKKLSKHPEQFGEGAIEGVAGPESANNAGVAGAFVPLLTLGIPSNAVTAVLLGALMMHNVQPGPMLMTVHPDVFWGVIISMYVGNCMLLVLNLPLIGLWVKILRIPYQFLFPIILLLCLIGSYSINNVEIDMFIMLIFGVVGYLAKKFNYELTPLILAFVLGPLFENSLQQSLSMSDGSFLIFFTRPISAIGMMIVAFLVISPFIPWIGKRMKPPTTSQE
jgi:putative tricarboxylic transport membrane protein